MGNTAEDLAKLWGKFSLSEEESLGVVVQEEALTAVAAKGQSCLAEKLLADRIIGKEAIRSTLIKG